MARRRSLGSSGADHEQRAIHDYNEAEHAADRARASAKAGQCVSALSTFRVATVTMGRAEAHERAGGTGFEVTERKKNARMAVDDAQAAINSSCLRK